jgi:hypothetical protein
MIHAVVRPHYFRVDLLLARKTEPGGNAAAGPPGMSHGQNGQTLKELSCV